MTDDQLMTEHARQRRLVRRYERDVAQLRQDVAGYVTVYHRIQEFETVLQEGDASMVNWRRIQAMRNVRDSRQELRTAERTLALQRERLHIVTRQHDIRLDLQENDTRHTWSEANWTVTHRPRGG